MPTARPLPFGGTVVVHARPPRPRTRTLFPLPRVSPFPSLGRILARRGRCPTPRAPAASISPATTVGMAGCASAPKTCLKGTPGVNKKNSSRGRRVTRSVRGVIGGLLAGLRLRDGTVVKGLSLSLGRPTAALPRASGSVAGQPSSQTASAGAAPAASSPNVALTGFTTAFVAPTFGVAPETCALDAGAPPAGAPPAAGAPTACAPSSASVALASGARASVSARAASSAASSGAAASGTAASGAASNCVAGAPLVSARPAGVALAGDHSIAALAVVAPSVAAPAVGAPAVAAVVAPAWGLAPVNSCPTAPPTPAVSARAAVGAPAVAAVVAPAWGLAPVNSCPTAPPTPAVSARAAGAPAAGAPAAGVRAAHPQAADAKAAGASPGAAPIAPPSADIAVVYSDVTCRVPPGAMDVDGLAVLWEDVVLE